MIAGPKTLAFVKEALDTIGACSSTKDKLTLIQAYKDEPGFAVVVRMATDPFMMYKIREATFIPNEGANISRALLFLKDMTRKKAATIEDRRTLSLLASVDEETIVVINRILCKDLRCGAQVRTLKKVFPDLFEYSPMLCEKELDVFERAIGGDWSHVIVEDKLDGVRCTAHVTKEGHAVYLSRNALPFNNCAVFDSDVLELTHWLMTDQPAGPDVIRWHIDGEVISVDRDFNKHMSNLKRMEAADPSQFRFHVFDLVPEYAPGHERKPTLKERKAFIADYVYGKKLLIPGPYKRTVQSVQDAFEACDEAISRGEEGVVLKDLRSEYVWDRDPRWCKVKKFHDADLVVTGWEYGTGKNAQKMGKLVCLYNGVEVRVGSGYTDQERVEFMTDCPKMIEVKYQEVTKDGSLRFPTFIRRRDDKA